MSVGFVGEYDRNLLSESHRNHCMGQRVTVTLNEELIDEYDELADEHGITRSEAMRQALNAGTNDDEDVRNLLLSIRRQIDEFSEDS